MPLTRKLWAAMVDVNNTVNTMITPETDMEIWGKEEVWSYPDRVGDCEDYVLAKYLQNRNTTFPLRAAISSS